MRKAQAHTTLQQMMADKFDEDQSLNKGNLIICYKICTAFYKKNKFSCQIFGQSLRERMPFKTYYNGCLFDEFF